MYSVVYKFKTTPACKGNASSCETLYPVNAESYCEQLTFGRYLWAMRLHNIQGAITFTCTGKSVSEVHAVFNSLFNNSKSNVKINSNT